PKMLVIDLRPQCIHRPIGKSMLDGIILTKKECAVQTPCHISVIINIGDIKSQIILIVENIISVQGQSRIIKFTCCPKSVIPVREVTIQPQSELPESIGYVEICPFVPVGTTLRRQLTR